MRAAGSADRTVPGAEAPAVPLHWAIPLPAGIDPASVLWDGRDDETAVAAATDPATVVELCRRHMGRGRAALGRLLGVVETFSEGAWIHAADGRRYLDFGGYGVFILGHRHPAVLAAEIGRAHV